MARTGAIDPFRTVVNDRYLEARHRGDGRTAESLGTFLAEPSRGNYLMLRHKSRKTARRGPLNSGIDWPMIMHDLFLSKMTHSP
jgi:hypothetical protein